MPREEYPEGRERFKMLARKAAIQLAWIAIVTAGWAAVSYAGYQIFGNSDAAFAIMGITLIPAGILALHGGDILSERF